MRIAIVGPAHPYKGGIPQHTTKLAHQLQAAGNEVEIISWRNQYPFFYPGEQFVPNGTPELPVFDATKRVLSWRNPVGWARWARKLRKFDEIVFVWFVPTIQGPVYLTMLKALGRGGPRKVIICHNVIQHSAGPADKKLARSVFKLADELIVHTDAQAALAREFTKTPVAVATLPAHLPGSPVKTKHSTTINKHLLFFGLVRRYKGLDILLQALATVPEISVTIAGEMWGKQKAALETQISELKLTDRVTLRPGYVPAEDIAGLFASADALVLPYRAGTATQNTDLAFIHGLPVIATKVGSMPGQIRDGVDGLLCEPEDATSLAQAIKHFYEPGMAAKLQQGIPTSSADDDWRTYVDVVAHI